MAVPKRCIFIPKVGPTGRTGPFGLVGDRGATGPTGNKGPTGVTGADGPVGFGYTGPVGINGDVGLTGPDGFVGPTGADGWKGGTGLTGPLGPTGWTGPQGYIGPSGTVTGPSGPDGERGATGITGPTGLDFVALDDGIIVRTGMVMFFGLNLGANYNGWLRCDGTQYDESEYPLLYFKLGNMYGGAPGTFRVPDLSGRFIRCTNYNSGTNGIGGGTPFQGEDDSFKSHTHTTSSNGQHAHSFTVYTLGVGTDNTQTYPINNFDSQSGVVVNTNVVGQHSHSMTSSGTVAETAPYSTVLNAYIYALE